MNVVSATKIGIWVVCGLLPGTVPAAMGADADAGADVRMVKRRLIAELLPATADKNAIRNAAERAHNFAAEMLDDGTWTTIDYKNTQRATWPVPGHLTRLIEMAVALRSPDGLLFENAALKEKILKGINHWLAKDYRNANWYPNEITVPGRIGSLYLLMEQDLTPAQMERGLKIMGRSKIGMTGANLVELSRNTILRGCLENDAAIVANAFRCIAGEIKISPGEGVQADFSFHQHGPCLYLGGYGAVFADNCAQMAYLAHETSFAFPAERMDILGRFLLDGVRWAIYRGAYDYGAFGRSISRPNAARGQVASILRACRRLAEMPGERQATFRAWADHLQNSGIDAEAPTGNRYFWRSTFMVHRRPEWYCSIRMFRKGLANTDTPSNDEGLRSHHLADGTTFVFTVGGEFEGIFPVWDWERIPGTTVERNNPPMTRETVRTEGLRTFVGGVSDGAYGAAAMDLARGPVKNSRMDERDVSLTAKKAWFCFEREIICLGAGISGDSAHPVLTSVNQCLRRGKTTTETGEQPEGEEERNGPFWIHHDGVGYIFPRNDAVRLHLGTQSGSWREINKVGSPEKTTRETFSLWFDHGVKPREATYAYALAPNVKATELPAYTKDPGWQIAANTPALQAVWHGTLGIVAAVFYEPGKLALDDVPTLEVNRSCLMLLREIEGGKLRLAVSKPDARADEMTTVRVGNRELRIKTPGGGNAGQSVVEEFLGALR